MHGGTIDAQNNKTGGAIFAIVIPINVKSSARQSATEA
jgi:K+-sensing histidine kinase KdpD